MSGPKRIIKTSRTRRERGPRGHRFEHWYVDNQVYFITARCRDQFPAFASESCKKVFWDRFEHYTNHAGFVPWIVSLIDNHYHMLGYNRQGDALRQMMRKMHGSIAKLVNDQLEARRVPFWRDTLGREFFDGCIRDERQARRAWRYTLTQARRHGVRDDYENYEHTRVYLDLERAIARAHALRAFMEDVRYPRYER